jgi:hypothetical protein
MSRKNNKAKHARHVAFLQAEEKARLEKNKKKNDARIRNKAIREGKLADPLK